MLVPYNTILIKNIWKKKSKILYFFRNIKMISGQRFQPLQSLKYKRMLYGRFPKASCFHIACNYDHFCRDKTTSVNQIFSEFYFTYFENMFYPKLHIEHNIVGVKLQTYIDMKSVQKLLFGVNLCRIVYCVGITCLQRFQSDIFQHTSLNQLFCISYYQQCFQSVLFCYQVVLCYFSKNYV